MMSRHRLSVVIVVLYVRALCSLPVDLEYVWL